MSTTYRRNREASGAHTLAIVLAIPFAMAFHGWALKTAWNWFVPSVTGWPRLGIAQAVGISIVLSVARPAKATADDDPARFWYGVALQVATVLLTLGIGWIVHEVMA